MKFGTSVTAIAGTVLAASALSLSIPGSASAGGYGCSGSLRKTYAVKSKWNTISHVKVYYNSSSGWNCAVNVKTKYYSQFKHKASIWLYNQTLAEDNVHEGVNTDSDSGKFKYYAGPVKVKGRNMCISFVADTWYYDEHAHLYKAGILCG
ncbi:hypothetical protein EDD29_2054 [Actinocorallia herbida]|uniref:Uncharacterized protein n=1 Tax=Actinocorallia herbida TaxID=58109 RepID=A0A3N1CT87_9ACTN|nr:hypothetical protein [Actinocorallia herbida]ROO84527.1 hypothetical protein EDD29_2054 [Actinocorallia herbida]